MKVLIEATARGRVNYYYYNLFVYTIKHSVFLHNKLFLITFALRWYMYIY